MKTQFTEISGKEISFLREILYQAIFVPPGIKPYPRSIIDEPAIIKYIDPWDSKRDFGLIIYIDKVPAGAIWGKFLDENNPGYGFIDSETPELSMAMLPAYRNQGYGTALITRFFELAINRDYKAISLSVDRLNPAVRLYKRMGFEIIDAPGSDYTMKICI